MIRPRSLSKKTFLERYPALLSRLTKASCVEKGALQHIKIRSIFRDTCQVEINLAHHMTSKFTQSKFLACCSLLSPVALTPLHCPCVKIYRYVALLGREGYRAEEESGSRRQLTRFVPIQRWRCDCLYEGDGILVPNHRTCFNGIKLPNSYII